MCQFRKCSPSEHHQQCWQTGNTHYQQFLISERLSRVIDRYLAVSFLALLILALVLCHGTTKLLLQFLDLPLMVSDQAVLHCVVLLE